MGLSASDPVNNAEQDHFTVEVFPPEELFVTTNRAKRVPQVTLGELNAWLWKFCESCV